MRKRNKLNLILIIFVIALILGIGYAYLTSNLNINGTTQVDSNTWNVYWDNVQVKEGSVYENTPVIDSTTKTTVTFSVYLSKPGDFYEFTIDAKNDGTIDAMINTITKTSNIPDYIKYDVSYKYGSEIENNHLLPANSIEKYKVRVEYRNDINPSDLPTVSQSLNFSFNVNYVQSNASAIELSNISYSQSEGYLYLGLPVNQNIDFYSNYQDIISQTNVPIFLKHTIDNNITTSLYVGFILNNTDYYLRVGGSTYNQENEKYNCDSIYYEQNKQLLNTIGASCTETPANNNICDLYRCNIYGFYSIIEVKKNGDIFVQNANNKCLATMDHSFCGKAIW